MTSQERVVRQSPQYGGFEDTQEELDWYGSNPEGIDRDRTPPTIDSDDSLPAVVREHDSNSSESEWSRPTYSDASRSPSPTLKPLPTSRHPAVKMQSMTVVRITCGQLCSFLHDAETRHDIKHTQRGI